MKASLIKPEVLLFTTPAELRALADRLERFWPERRLGDRTVFEIVGGEDIVVSFCGDQDLMAGGSR